MVSERNGRGGAPPVLGAHVSVLLRLPDGAEVWLDTAPAYDLVEGLVALARGDMKGPERAWVALAREEYTAAQWERMRTWFGGESPLGGAYVALVPLLPGDGDVAALPEAIERMPLGDFLRVAVTAGNVHPDAPLMTEELVALTASPTAARAFVDGSLRLLGRRRALLLRLLAEPEAARAEVVGLLRLHADRLYARLAPELATTRERAVERLRVLAHTRPEVVISWLHAFVHPAGFSPLVIAPLAMWHLHIGHYLHESRQPLFDGSAYEPLLLLIGAARVLEERPLAAPSGGNAVERWANVFGVLADPTRLRLLRLLAARPYYGQELAPALGVSGPTISHHLNALHRAGIVRMERRAHRTYLVLQRDALTELLADGQRYLFDVAPEDERKGAMS
ncbi:MAG: helix-turn-helix transcriptional regulator [Ktedonobacterales bacterium]|nr:helix-turn-helix transcriptional regulator [Ktedonobacterales bacterium]